MEQDFIQQLANTSAIQQIIYFINRIFGNVCVVFVTARPRDSQVKNVVHRNPHAVFLSVLLSTTLFYFEAASICFAISKFLLM